jgi:predicted phage terminase large subunit-like protein
VTVATGRDEPGVAKSKHQTAVDAKPSADEIARRRRLLARRRGEKLDQLCRAIVLEAGPTFQPGEGEPSFGTAFMRYYLPHYVSETLPDGSSRWVPMAAFHEDLMATVFGAMGTGEWHDYLAPRGYGKSTIVGLGLPLATLGLSGLAIAGKLPYTFNARHYVWLVQDTAPQAKQAMDAILDETERNPRVRADFPHLKPALDKHKRPIADRDDDVLFELNLRLQALGSGQKVRGRKNRQFRPDLVLIDDLENDESVNTKYQRDKLEDWLTSALGFALAKNGDLHYVGTLLHHDAVLARIRKKPEAVDGWQHHRYEAFDEHGNTTWEYMDEKQHRALKKRLGMRSYRREVLHKVTDPDNQRFKPEFFQYGERPVPTPAVVDERGTVIEEAVGVRCVIAVDPAVGLKKKNDRSALVVTLKKRGVPLFHHDYAWADRRRGKKIKRRIIAAFRLYTALGYAPVVVAETVQAQEWLKQELEDEGIPVRGVKPHVDKLTRAEPYALDYEQGRVQHAERLRGSEFESEHEEFPDGEHDDYVDAGGMGVDELRMEKGGGVAGVVQHRALSEHDGDDEWVDPRWAD